MTTKKSSKKSSEESEDMPEYSKEDVGEFVESLGNTCCDNICKDLNKEIYYRDLSIGKTYNRMIPVPRATSKLEKGDHPSPTMEEYEYPSPPFDKEALVEFRDSLNKTSCKCSKLQSDPSEDEMKEMISSSKGLIRLSPIIVRQLHKSDTSISISQDANTNSNNTCSTDVCESLNSKIADLEDSLNKEESLFKTNPAARGSSGTYVQNIYKSHMLKQYRRDLKTKGIVNCIE